MPIESPRGRASRSEPDSPGGPPKPGAALRDPVSEHPLIDSQEDDQRTSFTDGETVAGHLPSWAESELETPPSGEGIPHEYAPIGESNTFDDDDTDSLPRWTPPKGKLRAPAAPTSRVPFLALSVDAPTDDSADLLTGETVANVPVPPAFSSAGVKRSAPHHPLSTWETGSQETDDLGDTGGRPRHNPASLFDGEHSAESPPRDVVAAETSTTHQAQLVGQGPDSAPDEDAVPNEHGEFIESGPPMLTRWRAGPSRALRGGPRAMVLGGAGGGQVTSPHSAPPPATDIDASAGHASATRPQGTPGPAESTQLDELVAESAWPRELRVELTRAITLLRSLAQFAAYLEEEPREEFTRRMLAAHQCLRSASALLPTTDGPGDGHDDDDEGPR